MGLLRIGDNAPEFNVEGFFQRQSHGVFACRLQRKMVGAVFLSRRLHLHLSDGSDRLQQDGARRSPRKMRSSSAPAWTPSTAIARGRKSWAVWNIPCSSDESKTLSQRLRRARRKRRRRVARDFYHQSGRRHLLSSREPRERRPQRGRNPARAEGAAHGASLSVRLAAGRADGGFGAEILKIMDNGKLKMDNAEPRTK